MSSTAGVKTYDSAGHWIAGKEASSNRGAEFAVTNPLDDTVIAQVAEGTADDINRAIEVAHDTFQSFRHSLPKDREKILCKAAELLERDRAEFVDILVDER